MKIQNLKNIDQILQSLPAHSGEYIHAIGNIRCKLVNAIRVTERDGHYHKAQAAYDEALAFINSFFCGYSEAKNSRFMGSKKYRER